MSLNEFLVDSSLGSWADEMDALPSAPAPKTDEERSRDMGRSDFSSRPDRAPPPPREEVPLPTAPPYTAFVGNLAFDMTEAELEEFFTPNKTISVKIIADREGKPKGFGYVEFADLDGLKNALSKSGETLSHRTVRVNVAEPPKERERAGFGGGFDDDKYAGNWRRDGPLPAAEPSRGSRGSGFGNRERTSEEDEGPRRGARFQPSVDERPERPELNGDWRASRTGPLPAPEREEKKRGFGSNFESSGLADTEETWTKGSKFRPNPPANDGGSIGRKFGSGFDKPGSGPATASLADEGDWRSRARPAGRQGSFERSPSNSTPPTPQMGRKKLELLPRSGATSNASTPLTSPAPYSAGPSEKKTTSNPFGAAKPVDVSGREKEVEERLAKEREEVVSGHPLSRENSRQAREREPHPLSRETSHQATSRGEHSRPLSRETSRQGSTRGPQRTASSPVVSSVVRPTFSFAHAAKGATTSKDEKAPPSNVQTDKHADKSPEGGTLEKITEKVSEIIV